MTGDERTALAKVVVGMEIHRAEIRMLSSVVTALCRMMPSDLKAHARELIELRANLEPKFLVDEEMRERARLGITQVASSWISALQDDPRA